MKCPLLLPLLALALPALAADPATPSPADEPHAALPDADALAERIAECATGHTRSVMPEICHCDGRDANDPTNRLTIRMIGSLQRPVEALRGVPIEVFGTGGFGCCYEHFNLENIRGLDVHRLILANVDLAGGQDVIAGMSLRKFSVNGSAWTNLADLARMPYLETLRLQCGYPDGTPTDVSVLGSLRRLREFSLEGSWCGDLSWLARNPVEEVSLASWGRQVRVDLSFLRGLPIRSLHLENVVPADLSFVEGMPLTDLWLENSPVADLSPLKDLPLDSLFFDPVAVTSGLDVVRSKTSLKALATRRRYMAMDSEDPETFWKRYDEAWFGGVPGDGLRPDGVYCDRPSAVEYRIENGEATVVADISSGRARTTLNLPERLGDAPVVAIAASAFFRCDSLRSVSLPASLRTIEGSAFGLCFALESVSFSAGLERIGNWNFWGCKALRNVVLPDSVRLIDERAFGNCPNLETVVIGASAANIGNEAFGDCPRLASVRIASTNVVVGTNAFWWKDDNGGPHSPAVFEIGGVPASPPPYDKGNIVVDRDDDEDIGW